MNKEEARRRREESRAYECPTCKAPPGKACRTIRGPFAHRGMPTANHKARPVKRHVENPIQC